MSSFSTIAAILRYRAFSTPKSAAFIVLDARGKEMATLTWERLNAKAEKISQVIKEKARRYGKGDMIALVYRKAEIADFIAALYGVFYAGMVAVPVVTSSASDDLSELAFVLNSSSASLALTTEFNLKGIMKDMATAKHVSLANVEWWKTNEFGSSISKKKGAEELVTVNTTELAYIEYSKAPNGEIKGVAISHRTILSQCQTLKAAAMTNPEAIKSVDDISSPRNTDASGNVIMGEILLTYLESRQQVGLIMEHSGASILVTCPCTCLPDRWRIPDSSLTP